MSRVPLTRYPVASPSGAPPPPPLVETPYDFVEDEYSIQDLRYRRIAQRGPMVEKPTVKPKQDNQMLRKTMHGRISAVQTGLSKCQGNLAQLEKEEVAAEQQIEKEFKQLAAALHARREVLLGQVQGLRTVKAERLEAQSHELQQVLEQLGTGLRRLEHNDQEDVRVPELPDVTPCVDGTVKVKFENTKGVSKAIMSWGQADKVPPKRKSKAPPATSPICKSPVQRKVSSSRKSAVVDSPQQEILNSMASLHATYRSMGDVSAQLRKSHNIHID